MSWIFMNFRFPLPREFPAFWEREREARQAVWLPESLEYALGFVGCLVMSLAETLQALPVFSRRIHLAVGFQYVILSIALGKLMGSLIYFVTGIGERIGVG